MQNTLTLTIEHLSIQINVATKTIRSTLVRNPQAPHPWMVIPRQKRVLWFRNDVEKFYESQALPHGSSPDFSAIVSTKLQPMAAPITEGMNNKVRRGRPVKNAQLARFVSK